MSQLEILEKYFIHRQTNLRCYGSLRKKVRHNVIEIRFPNSTLFLFVCRDVNCKEYTNDNRIIELNDILSKRTK